MSRENRSVLIRPDRTRRLRAAKRRARMEVAVVVAIAVLALLLGWRTVAPTSSASRDTGSPSDTPSASQAAARIEVCDSGTGEPTPFFASYRSLQLYLPVSAGELTELGFHQASGDKAYHMVSYLPDADMTAVSGKRGTGRVAATETVGPPMLTGAVLRMWRSNRTGAPDTAADVGAKPGTIVFAPVTGRVVQVKPYRLYDKYDDYEIHIQPTGWPDIDVVLIHVDKPTVKAGDRVVGGCTQLAQVRRLSDRVTHQISAYTVDDGDHVHMQLNKIAVPGQLTPVGDS